MSIKKDKCLVCKKTTYDAFWSYVWKEKRGFCCETCGKAVHTAGYKILDTISDILQKKGCDVTTNKEKFGFYRLSVSVDTPEQQEIAKALFAEATKNFPEFSFDFDVYLKHETPTY